MNNNTAATMTDKEAARLARKVARMSPADQGRHFALRFVRDGEIVANLARKPAEFVAAYNDTIAIARKVGRIA